MYSTRVCPYCDMAKRLLNNKGVSFVEIRVDQHPERLAEMLERAKGRRSVPQIFINNVGIGGFDELSALESDGKLNEMLALNNEE